MSYPRSNSPTLLAQFLQTLSDARNSRNPHIISNCLCADPSYILRNGLMVSLRDELLQSPRAIQKTSERVLGDEWMGFTELVVSYLKYIVNLDPAVLYDTYGTGTTRAWHNNLRVYMSAINPAFNSPQGGILIPLVKATATLFTSAALRIDSQIRDPKYNCSHSVMNILLRTFNSTLGERTLATSTPTLQTLGKKAATLHIANLLFKLYFKLNQIRLCATIHSNINTASIPSYLYLFPKSDRCAYNYYLGRHHFFNAHFTISLATLQSAYSLARVKDLKQRRLILLYMITAGMILGKFPSAQLLSQPECYGFDQMFTPICNAIRQGDFRGFRRALGDEGPEQWRRKWWVQKELYLTLWNRCQILLWRGLIRRTFLITMPTLSAQQVANGVKPSPPTVSMNQILALAQFLHEDPSKANMHTNTNPLFLGTDEGSDDGEGGDDIDVDEGGYFGLKINMLDVESAIVSLCDQGFIKGYIARQATGPLVVLGRSGAFPPVAEIYSSSRWKTEDDGSGSEESNNGNNPFSMAAGGGGRVVNLSGVKAIGQRAF